MTNLKQSVSRNKSQAFNLDRQKKIDSLQFQLAFLLEGIEVMKGLINEAVKEKGGKNE